MSFRLRLEVDINFLQAAGINERVAVVLFIRFGITTRMGSYTFTVLALFLCLNVTGYWMRANATNINVHNQCSSTVCAKYWCPNNGVGGGCQQLAPGQTWTKGASPSWVGATVWAILNTGCGGQACNTGPPGGVSQFEFTLDSGGTDFYDISVLAGYNEAMRVVPTNGGCPSVDCRGQDANTCPEGYYPGGPDKTKACGYGTDYNLYLCQ